MISASELRKRHPPTQSNAYREVCRNILKSAKEGFTCCNVVTHDRLSQLEIEKLRRLGYQIYWNPSLLQYDIRW